MNQKRKSRLQVESLESRTVLSAKIDTAALLRDFLNERPVYGPALVKSATSENVSHTRAAGAKFEDSSFTEVWNGYWETTSDVSFGGFGEVNFVYDPGTGAVFGTSDNGASFTGAMKKNGQFLKGNVFHPTPGNGNFAIGFKPTFADTGETTAKGKPIMIDSTTHTEFDGKVRFDNTHTFTGTLSTELGSNTNRANLSAFILAPDTAKPGELVKATVLLKNLGPQVTGYGDVSINFRIMNGIGQFLERESVTKVAGLDDTSSDNFQFIAHLQSMGPAKNTAAFVIKFIVPDNVTENKIRLALGFSDFSGDRGAALLLSANGEPDVDEDNYFETVIQIIVPPPPV